MLSQKSPFPSAVVASPAALAGEQALLEQAQAMRTSAARVAHALPAAVVPVSVLLCNMYALSNCRFSFNNDPVPASYVMGPSGMLCCIAWGAQAAGHRLLGADLACSLRRDDRSLFGLRAVVPPITGNLADIVRGLVFMHSASTLFGLRSDAVIEVAHVFEMYEHEFKDLLANEESGEIAWPQPFRPH